MTYCLAMRLHEGLVFLSDTRTNAGVDNIGTDRKLHTFAPDPPAHDRDPVRGEPGDHPGAAGSNQT